VNINGFVLYTFALPLVQSSKMVKLVEPMAQLESVEIFGWLGHLACKADPTVKTVHMELITVIEYGSINECLFVKLRFNKIYTHTMA